MSISFDASELNAWVLDIGKLVNLLSVDANNKAELQTEWFLNPWENDGTRNIDGVPFRPPEVLTLLDLIMGPAEKVPPSLAGSSSQDIALKWYPIALNGTQSGVFLVTTDKAADYTEKDGSAASGLVGAGLRKDIALGDNMLSFSAYLPMVTLNSVSGGGVALGSATSTGEVDPIQFSAIAHSSTPLTDGSVTFSAVQILGELSFGESGMQKLSALYLDDNGNTVKTFDSARDFFASEGVAFVNNILAQQPVNDFLRAPISSTVSATPGTVLCDWLTLLDDGAAYTVLTKDEFTSRFLQKSALEVALDLVTNVLSNLAQDGPIIGIEDGGIYVVAVDGTDSGGNDHTDYGLNLRLPDFALGKAPSDTDAKASSSAETGTSPKLSLQIGKWLTTEDDYDGSWIARSEGSQKPVTPEITIPGLTATLLRKAKSSGDYSFHLGVALSSVGIDYKGTASDPLVKIYGFVLQGFELRGAASVDWDPNADDPLHWDLGGAVRFDEIGIPLGTSFGQASTEGKNPVAADAVSSGPQTSTGSGSGMTPTGTDAVNPVFSAAGSYMVNGTIAIQLYDANDTPTDVVWFPVQASFGPLFLDKLGVGWTQDTYTGTFSVDGGISVAGLSIELLNLSLGIPFTTLTDLSTYNLGLDGIGVTFKEGPIDLSAALYYSDPGAGEPPIYEGTALIQMWRVSVSASGSYTTVDGSPSLFVFGMINVPMGGIPAFFINGLSAGFGYNRSLTLPTIDKVDSYPLVSVLGQKPQPTATETLAAMDDYITPERGSYWLAGGLQWTTYEVVNTNALMNVEFGNGFEIGLIGLSVLSTPKETDIKFAYGELGIEVALDIGNDALIVEAALSPNSYVVDPKFNISGGFAMDAWWGDSHNGGDFVISLGGYSAQVDVPDYYPKLDRLGVSASIGKLVSLSGSFYMALTPSNIMAGGSLDVSASELGAELWFTGSADLIMYWQPFYFDAHMAVSAGCRYTVSMFGASCSVGLEASGTFDLWSPEFGGEVSLDFWFISLPISFGAPRTDGATEPEDWDTFSQLLPPPPSPPPQPETNALFVAPSAKLALAAEPAPATSTASDDGADLIQMSVQSGLLDFVTLDSGEQAWRIRAPFFSARCVTQLPLTEICFEDGSNGPVSLVQNDTPTGILPMQATITQAKQTLAVTDTNNALMSAADWHVTPQYQDLPLSIWSPPTDSPPADPATLPDCLTGVAVLRLSHTDTPSGPPAFPVAKALKRHDVAGGADSTLLVLDPKVPVQANTGGPVPSPDTIDEIGHINDTDTVSARDAVFDALAALTVSAGTNGSLSAMAASPKGALNASPLGGSVQQGRG